MTFSLTYDKAFAQSRPTSLSTSSCILILTLSHTIPQASLWRVLDQRVLLSTMLLIQILSLSVSENVHSSSRQLSVYESASFQIEKQFDIIMSFIESYLRRS